MPTIRPTPAQGGRDAGNLAVRAPPGYFYFRRDVAFETRLPGNQCGQLFTRADEIASRDL
jgi:hypothetical protein